MHVTDIVAQNVVIIHTKYGHLEVSVTQMHQTICTSSNQKKNNETMDLK